MHHRFWLGLLGAGCLLAGTAHAAGLVDHSPASADPRSSAAGDDGPLRTKDILELRGVGGFGVSPDGRQIAYSVYQANLETDNYRLDWFVAPTDLSAPPRRLLVDGGQPFSYTGAGGILLSERPKWSTDGEQIAFRRRGGERFGLVVVSMKTGEATEVADGVAQVEAFAWRPDGVLLYRTGLNVDRYHAEVAEEARRGWVQDNRVRMGSAQGWAPRPPACELTSKESACEVRILAVTTGGEKREATADESRFLSEAMDPIQKVPEAERLGVGKAAVSPADGRLVWVQAAGVGKVDGFDPMRRIVVQTPAPKPCLAKACTGQWTNPKLGWARGGAWVWFFRRSDSEAERTDLYVWDPKTPEPRLVHSGLELFTGCEAAGTNLFCQREHWTQPGRLVSIDLTSGRVKTLVDPNPQLAGRTFPKIENLPLKGSDGAAGYAHLVYPADYHVGRRYPLVVTTYVSHGFLKGGTGDEYPIFPLSTEGYFVLDVTYPYDEAARANMTSLEYQTATRRNEHETREVVGAIEAVVQAQIDRGLVDREKVAITGLSFGSALVHRAMRASSLFSVGITSGSGADLTSFALQPDTSGRAFLMQMYGERTLVAQPGGEVARLAWSQRPECLRAPLLMNLHGYEALGGFEGRAALAFAKRPVEVRVFPGEQHIFYRPQSFAGVYDNNFQWLAYWLKGEKDERPEFAAQYRRWDDMRAGLLAEKKSERPAPACE